MAAYNVLAEMGELHRTRPPATATTSMIAGWYHRKAQVFDHLAEMGMVGAAEQAATARLHSRELSAVAA